MLVLVAGCSRAPTTRPAPLPPHPWVLATNDPGSAVPALLWNGLIGMRFDRRGVGEDLFAIDAYAQEGEEKLLTLPSPLEVRPFYGGKRLEIDPTKEYRQALDLRTGLLTTLWSADSPVSVYVVAEALMHPEKREIAHRLTISPNRDGDAAFELKAPEPGTWVASGEEAHFQGATTRIAIAVRHGVAGRWLIAGESLRWEGGTDSDPAVSFETSVTREKIGPAPAFEDVQAETADIWHERWQTDIEIDGPDADQQAVRSFLFYLRSAIHPRAPMSISPFGLSHTQYNGHVFWDADIWVFPALALIDPAAAAAIPRYRLERRPQYEANFQEWLRAERPTAGKPLGPGPVDAGRGPGGGAIKVPWESSVTGRETVLGSSQWQHHITGSAAFAMKQAAALGLVEPSAAHAYVLSSGHFYHYRKVRTPSGWEIRDTMSPDENHTGHNDLYTNLLAQWAMNGGSWKTEPNTDLKLPRDEQGYLSYDQDRLRGYKQAAAVLAIYPLQFPAAEKEAKVMMSRFSDKVSPNGPAMSDSIHAIIWARLGERERAYEAWKASWEPFTTSPLLLFSEKRRRPITYFTTGAAGSLQAVVYGFLGFRLDSTKDPKAKWSKELLGDRWLSIKPNLPRQWKSVKFKNFTLLGQRYTLTATPGATLVSKGD